jgi:transcriptional regulator with XRE-family HTH domain
VNNEVAFKKQLTKIGEKLAELRKKKGYTSHETFAYDFELSRVQYWRIEKGKSNITLKSLCTLLEIHGIDLKDFFNSLSKS